MVDESTPSYPVTREKLYEMAWSEPMTEIAKRFEVSSSYLARVYTLLNVPRPTPGYWSKIAVGKSIDIPVLPESNPENAMGWDRHNDLPVTAPKAISQQSSRPQKLAKNNQTKSKRPDTHPLIRNVKDIFLKTRRSDIGYLRPYKRQLVDLIVSEAALNSALNIANTLFLILEECGHSVLCSSQIGKFQRPSVDEREKPGKRDRFYGNHWAPDRGTLVYIEDVAIGLTLFEFSESIEMVYVKGEYIPVAQLTDRLRRNADLTWTTHKDCPTGRFCLRAYAPYHGTSWMHQWHIPENADIGRLGRNIAKELQSHSEIVATEAAKALAEAEKRRAEWEEERRQLAIETENRRRKAAEEASRSELMRVIDKWSEQNRIESFFAEALAAAKQLPNEQQAKFLERIEGARKMVGTPDALTEMARWKTPDEYLTEIKSKPLWQS